MSGQNESPPRLEVSTKFFEDQFQAGGILSHREFIYNEQPRVAGKEPGKGKASFLPE